MFQCEIYIWRVYVMKKCAIVLAAGQGKRMNSKVAKQYLLIKDKPILYYSLATFEKSEVDEIVLVTGAGEEEFCQKEIVEKYDFTKVKKIVVGGKERYHSVANGLLACEKCDIVLIHDGARPFLEQDIIKRCIQSAAEVGACVAGMPVKDTIKIASEDGFVASTPNRNYVWTVQTPQTFQYDLIAQSYKKLLEEEENLKEKGVNVTDDAMVVEYFTGHKIRLVEGSYKNIKITTPEDLQVSEKFFEKN